ncbi:MAG: DUF1614 domain-containing protein [Gammaproteobacteria bacterium]|nr:DUF1614 domain-containing protein [Gammaproteobacteria bacterium]
MATPSRQKILLFLFAIAFLVTFIQVGLLSIAFYKLGLSPSAAYTLLLASLFGSVINLPLLRLQSLRPPDAPPPPPPIFPLLPVPHNSRYILVAVNTGGCLIPIAFSLYLLNQTPVTVLEAVQAISFVTLISYLFSRPIRGLGIGMPILVAPLSAALIAIGLNPEGSAPLAYIGGTMGVLIGADLLRLNDIRRMGPPVAAIGGAGTFDGIFITGIVAVLLT